MRQKPDQAMQSGKTGAALIIPELAPCPFCDYLQGSRDAVFVSRGRKVSVLVNPRQYERGALLVIPNSHTASLIDTDSESFLAVQVEARRMAALLVSQFGATGVNVFQNAGVSAGQTVPHYHVHVVPRYASSEPGKRFRESDYDVTSDEDLRQIADLLDAPRRAFLAQYTNTFEEEYERKPGLWRLLSLTWFAVALTAFVRLVLSPEIAFGWSGSIPMIIQMTAVVIYSRAVSSKSRGRLIAGYGISLALLVVSLLLTL